MGEKVVSLWKKLWVLNDFIKRNSQCPFEAQNMDLEMDFFKFCWALFREQACKKQCNVFIQYKVEMVY